MELIGKINIEFNNFGMADKISCDKILCFKLADEISYDNFLFQSNLRDIL